MSGRDQHGECEFLVDGADDCASATKTAISVRTRFGEWKLWPVCVQHVRDLRDDLAGMFQTTDPYGISDSAARRRRERLAGPFPDPSW